MCVFMENEVSLHSVLQCHLKTSWQKIDKQSDQHTRTPNSLPKTFHH